MAMTKEYLTAMVWVQTKVDLHPIRRSWNQKSLSNDPITKQQRGTF